MGGIGRSSAPSWKVSRDEGKEQKKRKKNIQEKERREKKKFERFELTGLSPVSPGIPRYFEVGRNPSAPSNVPIVASSVPGKKFNSYGSESSEGGQ